MNQQEIIIKTDGIEICAESFGNPGHPPILLIMGASASMVWWDEEFCQKLAEKGRFVIRYDNRDVGCSTTYEPGTINYDIIDMTNDALNVLDHYKVDKAHIIGMSLGGMIAQLIALRNPQRALTITMIASSVWDDIPGLPAIDEKILAYHSSAAEVNWTNEQSTIKYMVEGWRLLNGSKHPFDKKRAYRLAGAEFNRAKNLLSMFNHALLKGGESYYGKSNEIKIPSLVIHGTEDSILPYQHGQAISNTIPNTKFITLEGVGHEIHYRDYDLIIKEVIAHTNM
jgi:pimeloyl-ACP methyl ester carboxylesterase